LNGCTTPTSTNESAVTSCAATSQRSAPFSTQWKKRISRSNCAKATGRLLWISQNQT